MPNAVSLAQQSTPTQKAIAAYPGPDAEQAIIRIQSPQEFEIDDWSDSIYLISFFVLLGIVVVALWVTHRERISRRRYHRPQ